MGGIAATNSIARVIEAHGDEIQQEWAQEVPDQLKPPFRGVALSANNYSIQIEWEFDGGITLPGPVIDIEELADRYPDCNVSY
jgi:hypothetical protein